MVPRGRRGLAAAACAAALVAAAPAAGAAGPTVDDIFREPRIEGTRPALEALSPDGKWVAYAWNPEGLRSPLDLYLVPARGGEPRRLTRLPADARPDTLAGAPADSVRRLPEYFEEEKRHRVEAIAWAPDSRRLAFVARGDLFVTGLEPGGLARLTYTRAPEGEPVWSPDGRWLAFARGGAVWLLETDRAREVQLTEAGGDSAAPSSLVWAPDGRRIAFTTRDDRGLKDLLVPDYLGARVRTSTVKEGFPDMGVRIVELGPLVEPGADPLRDDPFRVLRLRLPAGKHPQVSALAWSPSGAQLAVSEVLSDMRTRELHVARADSGTVRTLHVDRDSAWIEEFDWVIADRPILAWSPDGESLLFASERSGFNHLWRVPAAGGAAQALTSGDWEVGWAEWLPDGRRIVLMGNRQRPSERHLEILDVATLQLGPLGTPPGMNTHPQMSRRGERLLFRSSRLAQPTDLWSLEPRPGARAVQLTRTVPDRFRAVDWVVPEIVGFPGRDGTRLHGLLYRPRGFDAARRYPVVVFVHGAGSMQNVVDGWTIYSPNFKFHTVLASKGYGVFEVDYRGSLGYGRDFRTGIHMHIGGKDLDDELAGADYLRGLAWVDPQRIGIYGGSYGGFMALMALFRAPEVYAAGCALRFVSDWANYYKGNPWYCVQRLGTPEANPEAYYRSSPLHFAAGLEDPLLLLHGVRDDNVHFQDAAQLAERLIRLGKDFEMMIYPREAHGFVAPESWIDEYRRIEAFFDRHLMGAGAAAAPARPASAR